LGKRNNKGSKFRMLTLIRTQTKEDAVKRSLEALLGQVDSGVWVGEVTVRIFRTIEKMLLNDRTSDSLICKLGRTMQVSSFYSIKDGSRANISFFEIYKKKSLLKNAE
jgi:hypothetical protein